MKASVFRFLLPPFLALEARAGIILTQFMQELDGKKPASTNTIRMDEDKVRIDMGGNPGAYLVYRGDKKVFRIVDLDRKTFSETSEKELRFMDREDIQKTVYKNTTRREWVGAWAAERYEGVRGGVKETDIWSSSPKTVGLRESDVVPLRNMARFLAGMGRFRMILAGGGGDGLYGIPVRTVAFENGKPSWASELREIRNEKLASSLFDIPAGFTRIRADKDSLRLRGGLAGSSAPGDTRSSQRAPDPVGFPQNRYFNAARVPALTK